MILVILAFLSLGIAWGVQQWTIKRRKQSVSRDGKENGALFNNPEGKKNWGDWDPIEYVYPSFGPWLEFNEKTTRPIPYRPFRWGPNYPINMGIRPMKPDNWIQLDNHYHKTLDIRRHRTNIQGELATRTLPGYLPHAEEVLQELSSFLSIRYPHCFTVTRFTYNSRNEKTWGDSMVGKEGGAVKSIHNKLTNEFWDFEAIRNEEGEAWNPMRIAGLLGQDDLAVMVEGTDGQYYFQAGSICTAGFWRLQDKIGLPLEEIHSRGRVPGWKDKLKPSMERFFQKLKVDKSVERNNYFFQIDDQLAWSQNTNGPEPIFDQGLKAPKNDLLAQSDDPTWKAPAETHDPSNVYFRTERQSLRRMPKTGCILFTIRTYFHRVIEIAPEPGVPGRMASAIRSWPTHVASYKGAELYGRCLLPYLDDLHEKQVKEGIVEQDEEGNWKANDNRYPF